MNRNINGIRKIVLVSTLLAIAVALDIITGLIPGLNLSMPLGGRLFNISLLPVMMIGIFVGPRYGILGAVVYGLLTFFLDGYALAYFASDLKEAVTVFMLDYMIAFGALGLTGLFRQSLDKRLHFVLGSFVALMVRWLSSTIVGALLWASYATSNEWTNNLLESVNNSAFIYSGIYNMIYTLTTFITINVIVLLSFRQLKIIKGQLNLAQ
ncbi:energy-coupled thiamine transporter ThiT [Acholeplasma hippikon]|uniref:Thiamine ECF transporter S component ThiT n=1 Tax=Acholeplasma hippikon TaxID=264636 RepID=A0A449BJA3_9MOLU|nr:energy-coupled thiamine transporter ThiT [Acholeplasma hippikon]VEU82522.1 Thiamine ECF transporter S component ThiT [Acholeplasma hippikon]